MLAVAEYQKKSMVAMDEFLRKIVAMTENCRLVITKFGGVYATLNSSQILKGMGIGSPPSPDRTPVKENSKGENVIVLPLKYTRPLAKITKKRRK